MVFGLSIATYTLLHVVISLIAIVSGLFVMFGLIKSERLARTTTLFLLTTALTSLTGFGFPFEHLLPSHIIGVLSLAILLPVVPARYVFNMSGVWRLVYVIGAALVLYLNVFVLVVQSFMKVPFLKALAPTQKEPPFVIAQLLVLLVFAGIGFLAALRFRPAATFAQRAMSAS